MLLIANSDKLTVVTVSTNILVALEHARELCKPYQHQQYRWGGWIPQGKHPIPLQATGSTLMFSILHGVELRLTVRAKCDTDRHAVDES